jgi:hypothetical protein
MPACGVCGGEVAPPFRAPAPELAPDLDMRPGEPTRSTLTQWVRTCRRCGACAPDPAVLPGDVGEIVRSAAYRAVDDVPQASRPFVRWSMLCRATERGEALLRAAWAADDAPDDDAARILRMRAAESWGEPDGAESALRLIDILRRAGAGDRAVAIADRLETMPLDENSARIVAFQRARLAARDTGRHLLSSALRPPARMPHVAHGKPKRAGFWGRLLGG